MGSGVQRHRAGARSLLAGRRLLQADRISGGKLGYAPAALVARFSTCGYRGGELFVDLGELVGEQQGLGGPTSGIENLVGDGVSKLLSGVVAAGDVAGIKEHTDLLERKVEVLGS